MAARSHAYAPYSGFAVGAALLTPEGQIFSGANVENAAYPVGLCAEASAIAGMIAAGAREISELLVCADSAEPVTPCGACRQRIFEFALPSARIHCADLRGAQTSFSLASLLPQAFGARHLVSNPNASEGETP